MRDIYVEVLPKVLSHEGGYVNHPKDPGGATNKGVTQGTYDDWRKSQGQVDDADVEGEINRLESRFVGVCERSAHTTAQARRYAWKPFTPAKAIRNGSAELYRGPERSAFLLSEELDLARIQVRHFEGERSEETIEFDPGVVGAHLKHSRGVNS